jgi:hypothetical protein
MRAALAIGLIIHAGWSVFSLTQVFKPRADWAPLRRRLVTLDALLAASSLWAASELLTGRSGRVPFALLGVLVLLLVPLPCYFGAVNTSSRVLLARNVLFIAIAVTFFGLAAGVLKV